jgi:hypothetical protein
VFGGGGRKRYAWGPGPVARPRFIGEGIVKVGEGIVKVGEYRARRIEWRRLFLTLVSGHVVGGFHERGKRSGSGLSCVIKPEGMMRESEGLLENDAKAQLAVLRDARGCE